MARPSKKSSTASKDSTKTKKSAAKSTVQTESKGSKKSTASAKSQDQAALKNKNNQNQKENKATDREVEGGCNEDGYRETGIGKYGHMCLDSRRHQQTKGEYQSQQAGQWQIIFLLFYQLRQNRRG